MNRLLACAIAISLVCCDEGGAGRPSAERSLEAKKKLPPPPPVTVASHDSCETAGAPLNLPAGRTVVTPQASLKTATAGYRGSCCSADGTPDQVYAVTPEVSGTLQVFLGVSPDLNLGLYARTSCEDAASEIGCAELHGTGDGELLEVEVTAGRTIYLFADGFQVGAGEATYSLVAELWPPQSYPTFRACASTVFGTIPSIQLTAGPGVTIVGDTRGQGPDYDVPSQLPGCAWVTGGQVSRGEDVVVSVTPSVSGTFEVKMTPTWGGSYDGILYLESACGAAASAITCSSATVGSWETVQAPVTAGTPIYVVFDSAFGFEGPFTATARLLP